MTDEVQLCIHDHEITDTPPALAWIDLTEPRLVDELRLRCEALGYEVYADPGGFVGRWRWRLGFPTA